MKSIGTELEMAIRFSETDAMGVVWHGNYLKFFEDAREYFGLQFGLEYLTIYKNGFFTPIVRSEIDHKAPIHYGEKVIIKIRYEKSASAKIIFHYEVLNGNTMQIAAIGKTIQVFLEEKTRVLELLKPAFFIEWEEKQNWE